MLKNGHIKACLCHQFFNLIRSNALRIICTAYKIFPLATFAEYLAFDTPDDALKFIRQFFMELDAVDQNSINIREGRAVFMPGGEAPSPESLQPTPCHWIQQKAQMLDLPKVSL